MPHQLKTLEDLKPAPYNPREITPEAAAGLSASVAQFGDISGIVWNRRSGHLVSGHQRLDALTARGGAFKTEPPRIVLDGESFAVRVVDWDELTEKAANVAANNPHIAGAFTDDLQGILASLHDVLPEFGELRLDALLQPVSGAGLTDPDAVPAAPETPTTVLGDTWLLGPHRVRCGDSTRGEDVSALLGGVEPLLMVTDPPYGVEYDPDWRNCAEKKTNSGRAIGRVQNDDKADWREAWALFPGHVAYVWHAGRFAAIVQASLEESGFEVRTQVIWAKTRFAISRGHYHYQHEPCWYAVRKGKTGHWSGDRKQTTLWTIEHLKSDTGHGTQKPIECMRRPIENNSAPGQPVYDPFLGSGTTLIAADMTGRVCYGMELDEKYCDVIVNRWQEFVGQEATLESTGQTFAEVKNEREKPAP